MPNRASIQPISSLINLDFLPTELEFIQEGTSFLSNEIHYRVAFLRETLNPNKRTGHIHVGFLNSDKDGMNPDNRDVMISTIKTILQDHILPTL
jgi:hypothetical protein